MVRTWKKLSFFGEVYREDEFKFHSASEFRKLPIRTSAFRLSQITDGIYLPVPPWMVHCLLTGLVVKQLVDASVTPQTVKAERSSLESPEYCHGRLPYPVYWRTLSYGSVSACVSLHSTYPFRPVECQALVALLASIRLLQYASGHKQIVLM